MNTYFKKALFECLFYCFKTEIKIRLIILMYRIKMVLTLSRIKIWSIEKYSPYFQKRSKNKSHYFLSLDTHLNAIIKLILNRSVVIHRYSKKHIALWTLMLWINLLVGQAIDPPVLSSEGDQAYCALSEQNIVTEFSIENNSGSTITAIYIQISLGYVRGEDVLRLTGSHNISSSWNPAEAKLTLKSATSEVDFNNLVNAVQDVVFYSSNPNPSQDKYFSISIGSANYLPSTQHYYEFVPSLSITWSAAKLAAENKNYFGIQGYLATILSQDESDISGKLTNGVGWIGGSDQEVEGTWKWVTGPEAGTVFWKGLSNGSTTN